MPKKSKCSSRIDRRTYRVTSESGNDLAYALGMGYEDEAREIQAAIDADVQAALYKDRLLNR